jgi:hypothetical protein
MTGMWRLKIEVLSHLKKNWISRLGQDVSWLVTCGWFCNVIFSPNPSTGWNTRKIPSNSRDSVFFFFLFDFAGLGRNFFSEKSFHVQTSLLRLTPFKLVYKWNDFDNLVQVRHFSSFFEFERRKTWRPHLRLKRLWKSCPSPVIRFVFRVKTKKDVVDSSTSENNRNILSKSGDPFRFSSLNAARRGGLIHEWKYLRSPVQVWWFNGCSQFELRKTRRTHVSSENTWKILAKSLKLAKQTESPDLDRIVEAVSLVDESDTSRLSSNSKHPLNHQTWTGLLKYFHSWMSPPRLAAFKLEKRTGFWMWFHSWMSPPRLSAFGLRKRNGSPD